MSQPNSASTSLPSRILRRLSWILHYSISTPGEDWEASRLPPEESVPAIRRSFGASILYPLLFCGPCPVLCVQQFLSSVLQLEAGLHCILALPFAFYPKLLSYTLIVVQAPELLLLSMDGKTIYWEAGKY